MKKLLLLLPALVLLGSCNQKEMRLSRGGFTVAEGVDNYSPIYIETAEDSTGIHLNEANRIAGTNYIFNIERELNLLKVIEKVKKVKDHKYNEENMHKDEMQVYYSYADTVAKLIAFFPFKEIDYTFDKPQSSDAYVYVNGGGEVFFEGEQITKEHLVNKLAEQDSLQLGFSKSLNFEQYLQMRLFLKEQELDAKFKAPDVIF